MKETLESSVDKFKRVLKEVPELRYAGVDPGLRTPAGQVEFTEGLQIVGRLADALERYRKATDYGRGLAAPQIGIPSAVFITYVGDAYSIFMNPRIVSRSVETNLYRELCLSSGIMAAEVERPETIVMAWMDGSGKMRQEQFTGMLARLYQHEEAHLRGVLNLDEAVPGGLTFLDFDPLQEQLRKAR